MIKKSKKKGYQTIMEIKSTRFIWKYKKIFTNNGTIDDSVALPV
jgi:hypothetical protein